MTRTRAEDLAKLLREFIATVMQERADDSDIVDTVNRMAREEELIELLADDDAA